MHKKAKNSKVSPITHIIIKGAKEHNLKNVDLAVPKRKLTVFTGLSGSGKSTMAMETIYAEGQRRYMESLSTYARQFLGELKRPDVEKIQGLSPAIAIDQKTTSHNPRSTVGTVTEIYDYMRLLYARVGTPYCIVCSKPLESLSKDEIVERIIHYIDTFLKEDTIGQKFGFRGYLVSPVVEQQKGSFEKLFINLRKAGWSNVYIDGKFYDLDVGFPSLDKNQKHDIWVVIDIFMITSKDWKEIKNSVEFFSKLTTDLDQAYQLEPSRVFMLVVKDKIRGIVKNPQHLEKVEYNTSAYCKEHDFSVPNLEPRHFSFNSPIAACEYCEGLGFLKQIGKDLLLNKEKSLLEGGIYPFDRHGSKVPDPFDKYRRLFFKVAEQNDIPLTIPVKDIPEYKLDILLQGDQKTYTVEVPNLGRELKIKNIGVMKFLENRYYSSKSESVKREINKYLIEKPCPQCNGARLKPQFLAVKIDGLNIHEVGEFSVRDLIKWIKSLNSKFAKSKQVIAKPILREILTRLEFLDSVGLGYLTLNRRSGTLSGGEAQRIRLASQIGTGLTDVVYVLDEPSIGLHARDQHKLITTLKGLRDLGNTVIVVEHDRDTIESADFVVDFGPKAGKDGGKVVYAGNVAGLKKSNTLTGKYLSNRLTVSSQVGKILTKQGINMPNKKQLLKHYIEIIGVKTHNLKDINVKFPLNYFTVVTGVSGSGKSSLVVDTLYPALARQFGYKSIKTVGQYKSILIHGQVNRVVLVDQSPIGRTPRSNPATYTGVFDDIRKLYANTKEAKLRGYPPGYFSFNVRGGRCEACRGEGVIKVEMMFLPDVYVKCDVCDGKRYTKEILQIKWHGASISDVLDMTVDEALEFFANIGSIRKKLQLLHDVGLGYIKLGQPAPTLSGGEAQRVKLAAELQRSPLKKTVYILDEPTTGLHFDDIVRLLVVLRKLVARGDTVIVIEHNIDFIKQADYIIDLGPEGGDLGGRVLYAGSLGGIKKCKNSITAKWI